MKVWGIKNLGAELWAACVVFFFLRVTILWRQKLPESLQAASKVYRRSHKSFYIGDFRGCGDISIIPRHPGNFLNVGAEGKLAGGTPDRDLNFQAIRMSSNKCQPQLGASWESPAVKVLTLKGPISLQRGWQCAPLGSTLEKTESLNRGHLPTPAKGSRDSECLWAKPCDWKQDYSL